MTIHIESLNFKTIIGLLDFERITAQSISIELEIVYDYEEKHFINYAEVALLVEENIKKEQYYLLEEALLSLKTLLSTLYPQMIQLFIKISKPDILDNCKVGLSKTWDF
ncbi:Dihydroneopterin aldolase [hydrothermal vent metagenome]|uniref:Dihydroneopterin aldolase n=1 Tax=hydrothermal vent metagenome TaxID=652676 RepID=A0A1W1C9X3_9ZZZZ